jgi:hypothetical protein
MYLGRAHGRHRGNFLARIFGDHRPHATARGSERHFYFDGVTTVRSFLDGQIVDETQIDDVDRNLRIETGLERGPNRLLAKLAGSFARIILRPGRKPDE